MFGGNTINEILLYILEYTTALVVNNITYEYGIWNIKHIVAAYNVEMHVKLWQVPYKNEFVSEGKSKRPKRTGSDVVDDYGSYSESKSHILVKFFVVYYIWEEWGIRGYHHLAGVLCI